MDIGHVGHSVDGWANWRTIPNLKKRLGMLRLSSRVEGLLWMFRLGPIDHEDHISGLRLLGLLGTTLKPTKSPNEHLRKATSSEASCGGPSCRSLAFMTIPPKLYSA